MPRAIFSVSSKQGIVGFARELVRLGWEIVASGGTEQTLADAGIAITPLERVTGQAEMLGGRVKTLHPAIHSGILARDTSEDFAELAASGIAPVSLVVCNLYPFSETIRDPDVTVPEAIEQIDIGGVTLLRAAAKNYARVTVLCDPQDYSDVLVALKTEGSTDLAQRRKLAVKAFGHSRDYDAAIHAYLCDSDIAEPAESEVPEGISIGVQRSHDLRYGENPHQAAAYYSRTEKRNPLGADQLAGKQLSYNNILDVDAAWRAASSFDEPTVVIVKHLNPTGIASADSLAEALPQALASDSKSAFGGIIAANRTVDAEFVSTLGSLFVEAIIAPSYAYEVVQKLQAGRKNCRVLQMPRPFTGRGFEFRSVTGGLLLQRSDMGDPVESRMKTVTRRLPSDAEMESLLFAWKAVQHVKSNAIVLAQGRRTVGVGGGLPSRVDAAELAIKKAAGETINAAMASDAFFPFPDSIEFAARAGVTCVIQPGGSIRDAQVIEAADHHDMAMILTGSRHFRH
ncbi:MAG: bifunctional phosphoribosylaminoimidazolecarboxamide formyltransferase/IMP cyclohydrolase [Chloroflexota bacterium]|nr:bifunctional phosphoribosylaminoimidazolecarboxamide formyltransferase/IMP cyclohydrolase [Chloroflexota bacterium]MDE2947035.1 bifunctional phosphoribosylaminoimidazolecarboxamide formyltransferase/IMP cyclohydrolase [Chloroflexota bacterium]